MCVLVCKREEGAGEGEPRAEGVHIEPCVGAELGEMCAELLHDCKAWPACLILQGDKIPKWEVVGWLSSSSFSFYHFHHLLMNSEEQFISPGKCPKGAQIKGRL